MMIENRSNGTISLDGENEKERAVKGYAHRYGTVYEYTVYSWATDSWVKVREIFEQGAFDGADISSVYFRHNHNRQARGLAHPRNKTLLINPDEIGLGFAAYLSDTQAGRDLHQDVKSGMTVEMSFAFSIDDADKEAVEYIRLNDELIERRVKKVAKIYDISTVDFPAFSGTSVEAKAMEDGSEKIEQRNGFPGLNSFLKDEHQQRKANEKLELEKRKLQVMIDTEI